MLDWDAFRIILAIGREGSLSQAGQKLGVSHPTVGRQLKRAEDQLGTKLFDRLSTGLHPTKEGEKAISFGEQIEQTVGRANIELFGVNDVMEGTLRISVPLNTYAYGLSEDLAAFSTIYPDINFHVKTSEEQSSFLNRNVDIVIRAANNPSSGLWGYRLYSASFSFFASREFHDRWAKKIEKDPEGAELPYIVMNDTDPERDSHQLLRQFPRAKPVAETNVLDTVKEMVADGLGAGRLADIMVRKSDEFHQLVACSGAYDRSVWALTHPDFRSTRRIRVFMEFLRDRFAERAA